MEPDGYFEGRFTEGEFEPCVFCGGPMMFQGTLGTMDKWQCQECEATYTESRHIPDPTRPVTVTSQVWVTITEEPE